MPPTVARYDGHADWYDAWNRPNAERNAADVRELLGPGDGLSLDLVRSRVGMRHHPLAGVLTAFIVTGLVIGQVAEPGDRPVPTFLAIRARKPGSGSGEPPPGSP